MSRGGKGTRLAPYEVSDSDSELRRPTNSVPRFQEVADSDAEATDLGATFSTPPTRPTPPTWPKATPRQTTVTSTTLGQAVEVQPLLRSTTSNFTAAEPQHAGTSGGSDDEPPRNGLRSTLGGAASRTRRGRSDTPTSQFGSIENTDVKGVAWRSRRRTAGSSRIEPCEESHNDAEDQAPYNRPGSGRDELDVTDEPRPRKALQALTTARDKKVLAKESALSGGNVTSSQPQESVGDVTDDEPPRKGLRSTLEDVAPRSRRRSTRSSRVEPHEETDDDAEDETLYNSAANGSDELDVAGKPDLQTFQDFNTARNKVVALGFTTSRGNVTVVPPQQSVRSDSDDQDDEPPRNGLRSTLGGVASHKRRGGRDTPTPQHGQAGNRVKSVAMRSRRLDARSTVADPCEESGDEDYTPQPWLSDGSADEATPELTFDDSAEDDELYEGRQEGFSEDSDVEDAATPGPLRKKARLAAFDTTPPSQKLEIAAPKPDQQLKLTPFAVVRTPTSSRHTGGNGSITNDLTKRRSVGEHLQSQDGELDDEFDGDDELDATVLADLAKPRRHSPMEPRLEETAKHPVFEARLRQYLDGHMKLGSLDMTPENYLDLHAKPVEEWHSLLSDMILPEAKVLMEADRAPTVEELLALPEIDGDWNPGAYISIIISYTEDGLIDFIELVYLYTGSATAVAKGLVCRTAQHDNPVVRAYETKRSGSFHYELVDEPGKNRMQHFRKIAVTEFTSGLAVDVRDVRFGCVLAESVVMSWLRGIAKKTRHLNAGYLTLTPWTSTEYGGANLTPPLKQTLPGLGEIRDTHVLTPEAWLARHRERKRQWTETKTDAQRVREDQYMSLYSKNISGPRAKMRNAGVSEEEIAEFVQDELDKIHAQLPARTKGTNRRQRAGAAR
ncbi:hypothetical protein LTR42_011543 [Elasticomyces elasticus]|nr:hypothetical protein LTR42_011543 [Elasticomyces elasticus]